MVTTAEQESASPVPRPANSGRRPAARKAGGGGRQRGGPRGGGSTGRPRRHAAAPQRARDRRDRQHERRHGRGDRQCRGPGASASTGGPTRCARSPPRRCEPVDISTCTAASGPDRSATACAANPPACRAIPASHNGWRAAGTPAGAVPPTTAARRPPALFHGRSSPVEHGGGQRGHDHYHHGDHSRNGASCQAIRKSPPFQW